jgi:hypothetical protein
MDESRLNPFQLLHHLEEAHGLDYDALYDLDSDELRSLHRDLHHPWIGEDLESLKVFLS